MAKGGERIRSVNAVAREQGKDCMSVGFTSMEVIGNLGRNSFSVVEAVKLVSGGLKSDGGGYKEGRAMDNWWIVRPSSLR